MSLPKSRILLNSKGFAAAADFHNNSPEQSTVVNVNLNQSTTSKDNINSLPSHEGQDEIVYPSLPNQLADANQIIYPPASEDKSFVTSPHAEAVRETSAPAAAQQFLPRNDLNSLIRTKDNIIHAYSLLLDIIESNPLIINKQVIAEIDSLSHLILFLTEADTVDVQVSNDIECSCVGSTKFVAVEKIFVTKNNETLNFKYNYADANKFLSEHHVSTKFVVDRA